MIPYVNWSTAPSCCHSLFRSARCVCAGRRQNNNICLRRKFKHVQIYNLKSSFHSVALHKSNKTHANPVNLYMFPSLLLTIFPFFEFYIALDRVLCACFFRVVVFLLSFISGATFWNGKFNDQKNLNIK